MKCVRACSCLRVDFFVHTRRNMSASVCVYRCHAPLGFECYSPLLAATARAQESSAVL